MLRQRHAGIVGLHDQRDHAIDRDGDPDSDNRQHERLGPECSRAGTAASVIAMISADRMKSVLIALATFSSSSVCGFNATVPSCGFMRVRMMRHDGFEHLFHALVAEIGAAEHQQRRDRPGQEVAERQRGGQQDQELVAKRSRRDLADDRQFALGGESDHVAWRDRGIVDDDAGRLDPRLGGLADHIVKRSRRHLCDRRDIVEKGDQSDAHR